MHWQINIKQKKKKANDIIHIYLNDFMQQTFEILFIYIKKYLTMQRALPVSAKQLQQQVSQL